jgi:hypothetical protein
MLLTSAFGHWLKINVPLPIVTQGVLGVVVRVVEDVAERTLEHHVVQLQHDLTNIGLEVGREVYKCALTLWPNVVGEGGVLEARDLWLLGRAVVLAKAPPHDVVWWGGIYLGRAPRFVDVDAGARHVGKRVVRAVLVCEGKDALLADGSVAGLVLAHRRRRVVPACAIPILLDVDDATVVHLETAGGVGVKGGGIPGQRQASVGDRALGVYGVSLIVLPLSCVIHGGEKWAQPGIISGPRG